MTGTYHHGHLREALLAEATRCVRSGEIETFSLRGTAKKLGVSPAAVYHHFSDRAALMNAVIRETGIALNARLLAAVTPPPPAGEQAMRLGLAYIDFAINEPALFAQLTGTSCPEAEDVQDASLALVADALARDAVNDQITPARLRERVWAAWAISHGFASLALAGRLTPDEARTAFRHECHRSFS
jgi:AcrR family transcriptional regulator